MQKSKKRTETKDTCCLYSPFLFTVRKISNKGTPTDAVASCLKEKNQSMKNSETIIENYKSISTSKKHKKTGANAKYLYTQEMLHA